MTATPRHHTPRSDLPTRGGQVAAIAEAKGKPLMPHQRLAADVALEYDPDTGLYRYGTIIKTVQRQAGKTLWVGDLADHRCIRRPGAKVRITMQNGKTADEWMREQHHETLVPAFGEPGRKASPYSLTLRAGSVGVQWRNRSSFTTFPPKRNALHSKQTDLAIISEAWDYSAEQGADVIQALRPTMLTRANSQLVVESTLGDDSSVFLDGYYDMGVASLESPDTTRVCFIDYGIADDVDPEDLQAVADAHPAYGYTVTMTALRDAYEQFVTGKEEGGIAGWARAYGNRATRTRTAAIPAAAWSTAGRPRPDVPPRTGLAFDVAPGGTRAAIAAGWRDEGHAFVEVLHAGPVSRELPALLVALAKARRVPIVVDRGSMSALEVVDAIALQSPSTEVRFLSMAEYAQACGMFYRGILDDTVHHFNDPDLDAAVEVATKRDLGDGGFGWGRKGSAGSIAELVAATVALKAFDVLPKPKLPPVLVVSR